MKNIFKKIELTEGQTMPRGYGLAWLETNRLVYVCYLFPLNHFVAAARKLYLKFRHASIKNEITFARWAIGKTAEDVDLNLIYIRCKNKDGKWDSMSLSEAPRAEAYRWFVDRIMGLLKLDKEGPIEERHVKAMTVVLEKMGIQLYRYQVLEPGKPKPKKFKVF